MSTVFELIKQLLGFIKIILVFCMLMLLLYWIQNLAHLDWRWLGFITPFLDFLISAGKAISSGSMKLFDAVFEYKYFWALVLLGVMYAITHLLRIGTEKLEEVFDTGRRVVKRIEENNLNNQLQKEQTGEQLAIRRYQIYISTTIKKKFSHLEQNVNLEEQNKIMNKFLMEKLGIAPVKYKDGFLYSFSDFNKVDNVLDVFFKVLKSNSPLNYFISVQVLTGENDTSNLDTLIDLKFENKISMLSNTAFRYKFNASHRYGISQLGIYQKENNTVEAHEFIVI